jgi:hypothetical protein
MNGFVTGLVFIGKKKEKKLRIIERVVSIKNVN